MPKKKGARIAHCPFCESDQIKTVSQKKTGDPPLKCESCGETFGWDAVKWKDL